MTVNPETQLAELWSQYRLDCSLEALQAFEALAARMIAEGCLGEGDLERLRQSPGWNMSAPS